MLSTTEVVEVSLSVISTDTELGITKLAAEDGIVELQIVVYSGTFVPPVRIISSCTQQTPTAPNNCLPQTCKYALSEFSHSGGQDWWMQSRMPYSKFG
jgi:hypothetical protein